MFCFVLFCFFHNSVYKDCKTEKLARSEIMDLLYTANISVLAVSGLVHPEPVAYNPAQNSWDTSTCGL